MLAAILALSLVALPAAHERATLLSEYRAVHSELDARYPDWSRASKSADFPRTLNHAWRIIGDWTALYLNSHPSASAHDVVDAIRQLDRAGSGEYRIEAEAVQLDGAAWAISASYIHAGTFFVVARDRGGPFAVRWQPTPPAVPA